MSKFYDRAKIFIKAGKGGDGLVAFLREKYRPDGGPAGGDGGCGGSVIIKVDEGLHNLSHFRYHSHFKARNGENGMTKSRYGKGAEDLILTVPPGTIIRDAKTHKLVADLLHQRIVFAWPRVDVEVVAIKNLRLTITQLLKWQKMVNLGKKWNLI